MNSSSWQKDTVKSKACQKSELGKTFFQLLQVPGILSHEDAAVESNTSKNLFSINQY